MKSIFKTGLFMLVIACLSSCGSGNGTSSSSRLFGNIPGLINKYDSEKESLKSEMNENNFKKISEKIDKLKEETIAKISEEGQSFNGKELPIAMNEEELKVEQPVTLLYKGESKGATLHADFDLAGKIVAAKDLTLNIDPKDLKGESLLGGGKIVVTVTLPVHIEFSDKEGNVIDSRTIGRLAAENNGETAIIKAGTPIEFNGIIPVTTKYLNVESARLVIDLNKGLASRSLAK